LCFSVFLLAYPDHFVFVELSAARFHARFLPASVQSFVFPSGEISTACIGVRETISPSLISFLHPRLQFVLPPIAHVSLSAGLQFLVVNDFLLVMFLIFPSFH
jgi:hypothetical protein